MAELITVLLYVLATARLLQLIQKDEILHGFRTWWLNRSPQGSLREYWISCAWCVSVAAALLPAAAYVTCPHHPAPRVAAAILAFSWLAVLLKDIQALAFGKAALYAPQPPTPEQEAGH